ncbi:transposase [Nocardia sp. NPDC050793]|uniref:transposase n=1 Tax=Nocardia sp. NPDC050793 TaxID=3155159 RepID=UPI0033D81650
MVAPKKYSDALRAEAVRRYQASDPKPTFRNLAEQLGVHPEALRLWVRRAEFGTCIVDSPSRAMARENKLLRQRVQRLERMIEILRSMRTISNSAYGRIRN